MDKPHIIHVDMDAFFAAVEQRNHPEYRGKPVIVGGKPHTRGVVATASYEARAYGVRSGMSLWEAGNLCPHGIFVSGNHREYAMVSRQIMQILGSFTPQLEQVSIDEAFLDVSGCERLFGSAEDIGWAIKKRIRREVGLTASVGISVNKFLAKLASDLEKPNGFVVIRQEEIRGTLENLPVSRLWGVGEKTEKVLTNLGIRTIGMLAQIPVELLAAHLGPAMAEHLHRLSLGEDDRPVAPPDEIKSMGHETTFPKDVADPEVLKAALLSLCEQVARRLRKSGLQGRTVTLKIRDANFKTVTRNLTLSFYTNSGEIIYQAGLQLLAKIPLVGKSYRLIGISVCHLVEGDFYQPSLFDNGEEDKRRQLNEVLDRLKDRFGEQAVTRATLIKDPFQEYD